MNNISLIIESHYFANITCYKKLCNSKHIIIEQYDEHKKRSFANRSVILGANGIILLSVPLQKGRSQKTILKEVRISNAENWQQRHWRSIISSYNNSPWFKHFSDDLSELFSSRYEFLLDWNLACLDWTLRQLKLEMGYQLTEKWEGQLPAETEDFRNKIVPDQGPSLDDLRYPQVFENKFGFVPDLSILDLLFCEGPKSALLLLKRGSAL